VAAVLAGVLLAGVAAAGPEWAVAVFPSGAEFNLEIAADPPSRALGYMGREHIGPRDGMLFIFDEIAPHSMWMKNCKTTIDMIWLDAQLRVVHLALDREPCPPEGDCPLIAPLRAASYVLEVAGGTVGREGLDLGDTLVIVAEPPLQ
jgi:uncharacterized membrane protein (UPF0127 family)